MVAILLAGLVVLSGPSPLRADQQSGVVSRTDLDRAMEQRANDEEGARQTIRRLLQRDDVQKMTQGYGLDLRRAEAAVGTLQGDELQRLAAQAAQVDAQLAGGDELYLHISLVAALLIVIIVILLTQ
jgi:hypothetical protein